MYCKKCGSYNVEVEVGRRYTKHTGIRNNNWIRYTTCHDCGCRVMDYGDFGPRVKTYCEVR